MEIFGDHSSKVLLKKVSPFWGVKLNFKNIIVKAFRYIAL
jgi:hypothetical protein